MNALSPWAAAVKDIFNHPDEPIIFKWECREYTAELYCIANALWITVNCPHGGRVVLRAAYSPNGYLKVKKVHPYERGVNIRLEAAIGQYEVTLSFPEDNEPMLRYTTAFTATNPLMVPFWPRDLIITNARDANRSPEGRVHISQVGARSGLQFIGMDKSQSGSLLYMQNLTALNDYCQATETSAAGVVGGQWPELGLALPPTGEKPVPSGKKFILSDAFLLFSPDNPKDGLQLGKQFINMLAAIYLHLPRPDTSYHNWPDILNKGLADLQFNHACWTHAGGHDYLNAYTCDYETPPELMVQLAVLLPLLEYRDWSKEEMPAIQTIKAGLDAFYDKKLGTVVRWLPSLAADLDGSEEQLKPNVMDSWYLHHPMLYLSWMANKGDKQAKKLFLDSLPFTIKVAHYFNYEWPVFYNMETLEVIKAETQPGKGGEKDVAGLYAHVMLQAWQLTKQKKYFNEARKAIRTLLDKGFEIFYQANNTAYCANAALRIYKETQDQQYLDLCYLCLANIMKNMQLWECNYGYAKNYPTFFGVFPLNDAPYTAAYEEQEVFSAMHNLLIDAEGEDILPSVSLLLAEFIRYIVQRAAFYYPPNLPKEMLSDEVKMGEVDPKLWIALEDIQDGWKKSGTIGQEVYGAGVAFGIVPYHFHHVKSGNFRIYVDYPVIDFKSGKGKAVFCVKGSERLNCRMMIMSTNDQLLPEFKVTGKRENKKEESKGKLRKDGYLEFLITGNQEIEVKWH